MSGNVVAVLVVFLVLLFITMGAAIPMIVFWYNREDTRIYDGLRARLMEELARLSLDVDELVKDLDHVREQLYEERRERAIKERDLELVIAANIQLGDKVAQLEIQVAEVKELRRENVTLRAENATLHNTQNQLEARVAHLEAELALTKAGPGE